MEGLGSWVVWFGLDLDGLGVVSMALVFVGWAWIGMVFVLSG